MDEYRLRYVTAHINSAVGFALTKFVLQERSWRPWKLGCEETRMITPQTDAYAPVVKFGMPAHERSSTAALAIFLAVGGMASWVFWIVPFGLRAAVTAGLLISAIAFGVRAFRIHAVEVDIHAQQYRSVSGLLLFAKPQAYDLDQRMQLRYSTCIAFNPVNGQPEEKCDAWIYSGNQRLPLLLGWKSVTAPEFLGLLAERLAAPVERLDHASGRRVWSSAVGSALAWASVIGVFAVMFWPILSGKRPFRSAWAVPTITGTRQIPQSEIKFSDAVVLYRQNRFVEAEQLLQESIEQGKDRSEAFNMIAYCLAGQKRMDEALKTAKRALSYSPESGNIIDTVGEMHELRGEYKLAVEWYLKALSKPTLLAPQAETHAKLGRSLLALGRQQEAVVYLKEAARFPQAPYGQIAVEILRRLGEELPQPSLGARRGVRRVVLL